MSKRPSRKPAATEPVPIKFILPIAGVILLRLVASLFPGSALWGLDFLRYLPMPATIALTLAGLVVAFDRLGFFQKTVDATARFLFPDSAGRRILIFAALSVGIVAVFSVWTIPYPFLGDGKHVVTTLYRILKGDTAAQGPLWNEPLTHLYYLAAFKIFSPGTLLEQGINLKGYFGIFKWTSYILGGIYVFSVLALSGKLTRNVTERLALVAGIFGCGGMLLYFGYLEYYAFLYLFGTAFVLVALGELKDRKAPVRSGVLLAAAIAFHLSAVVFIPAYVYLFADYRRSASGKTGFASRQVIRAAGAALVACALFYAGLDIAGVGGFFIPMLPGSTPWALLSVQHALDILNNVFVHAPFAAAVLIAYFIGRSKPDAPSREVHFVSIAAAFWFALIVAHSAIARDWDVYALFGVSISVTAFSLVARMPQAVVRRYYYRQMAVQPLLLFLPWVAVNAATGAALQKALDFTHHYEDILPVDVTTGCYETIREFNVDIKNYEGELIMLRKILELQPDRYQYYKLGRSVARRDALNERELAAVEESMKNILALPESERLLPCGESGHAASMNLNEVYLVLMLTHARVSGANRQEWLDKAARRLVAAGGNAFRAGLATGKAYAGPGDHAKAKEWYLRALADSSGADTKGEYTVPKLLSAIAVSFFAEGKSAQALEFFRQAANHPNTDPRVVSDYGFACYLLKRYEESEQAFRRVLKADPADKNALYCLGRMAIVQPEKREEGIRLLGMYLQRYPNGKTADQVRAILASPPVGLSSIQP